VIFAEEWRDYPVTLVAEHNATHGFVPGRLSRELLQSVPDIANRTVMTCGPAPYMDIVEKEVKALGVTRFFKEQFFTPVAEAATSGIQFTKLQPAQTFFGRVGTTLLEALESNKGAGSGCLSCWRACHPRCLHVKPKPPRAHRRQNCTASCNSRLSCRYGVDSGTARLSHGRPVALRVGFYDLNRHAGSVSLANPTATQVLSPAQTALPLKTPPPASR
jgi:hypothetical protein